jgi:hypothetical protein
LPERSPTRGMHHGRVTGLPTELQDPDEQLVHAVLEEQQLWELSQGNECHAHGSPVYHPAPEPAWASARLLQWFDAGLIEVVDDCAPDPAVMIEYPEEERMRLWLSDWHPVLPPERARAALTRPSCWTLEQPEGLFGLRPTDRGLKAGGPEWGVSWMDTEPRPTLRNSAQRLGAWIRRRLNP